MRLATFKRVSQVLALVGLGVLASTAAAVSITLPAAESSSGQTSQSLDAIAGCDFPFIYEEGDKVGITFNMTRIATADNPDADTLVLDVVATFHDDFTEAAQFRDMSTVTGHLNFPLRITSAAGEAVIEVAVPLSSSQPIGELDWEDQYVMSGSSEPLVVPLETLGIEDAWQVSVDLIALETFGQYSEDDDYQYISPDTSLEIATTCPLQLAGAAASFPEYELGYLNSVSAERLMLAPAAPGGTTTGAVTLKNTGADLLSFLEISAELPDFMTLSHQCDVLAPGESCQLEVNYTAQHEVEVPNEACDFSNFNYLDNSCEWVLLKTVPVRELVEGSLRLLITSAATNSTQELVVGVSAGASPGDEVDMQCQAEAFASVTPQLLDSAEANGVPIDVTVIVNEDYALAMDYRQRDVMATLTYGDGISGSSPTIVELRLGYDSPFHADGAFRFRDFKNVRIYPDLAEPQSLQSLQLNFTRAGKPDIELECNVLGATQQPLNSLTETNYSNAEGVLSFGATTEQADLSTQFSYAQGDASALTGKFDLASVSVGLIPLFDFWQFTARVDFEESSLWQAQFESTGVELEARAEIKAVVLTVDLFGLEIPFHLGSACSEGREMIISLQQMGALPTRLDGGFSFSPFEVCGQFTSLLNASFTHPDNRVEVRLQPPRSVLPEYHYEQL